MSDYPKCEFEDCYCKRHYPNRSGGDELEVVDEDGEILIYCEVAIENCDECKHKCAFCNRFMIGSGLKLKRLPEINGKLLFLKRQFLNSEGSLKQNGIFVNSSTQLVSSQGRIIGKLVSQKVRPLKRDDYLTLEKLGIDVGETKYYCVRCFDPDQFGTFVEIEEAKDPCFLYKIFPHTKKKEACQKCGLNHSKHEFDSFVTPDGEKISIYISKDRVYQLNKIIENGNVGVLTLFEAFFQYKQNLKEEKKRKKAEILAENKERAKLLIKLYFPNATEQELQTIVNLKSKDSVEKRVVEKLMKEKDLLKFVKWLRE